MVGLPHQKFVGNQSSFLNRTECEIFPQHNTKRYLYFGANGAWKESTLLNPLPVYNIKFCSDTLVQICFFNSFGVTKNYDSCCTLGLGQNYSYLNSFCLLWAGSGWKSLLTPSSTFSCIKRTEFRGHDEKTTAVRKGTVNWLMTGKIWISCQWLVQ